MKAVLGTQPKVEARVGIPSEIEERPLPPLVRLQVTVHQNTQTISVV